MQNPSIMPDTSSWQIAKPRKPTKALSGILKGRAHTSTGCSSLCKCLITKGQYAALSANDAKYESESESESDYDSPMFMVSTEEGDVPPDHGLTGLLKYPNASRDEILKRLRKKEELVRCRFAASHGKLWGIFGW